MVSRPCLRDFHAEAPLQIHKRPRTVLRCFVEHLACNALPALSNVAHASSAQFDWEGLFDVCTVASRGGFRRAATAPAIMPARPPQNAVSMITSACDMANCQWRKRTEIISAFCTLNTATSSIKTKTINILNLILLLAQQFEKTDEPHSAELVERTLCGIAQITPRLSHPSFHLAPRALAGIAE